MKSFGQTTISSHSIRLSLPCLAAILVSLSALVCASELEQGKKKQLSEDDWIKTCIRIIEDRPTESGESQRRLLAIGKPAVKPLLKLIKESKDNQARRVAIWTLAKIQDTEALPAIAELLDDDDEWVRVYATRAFGFYGDKGAIKMEWVLRALRDKSRNVRMHAIYSLCYIRDPRFVAPLLQILTDVVSNHKGSPRDIYQIEQALMITTGYDPGFKLDATDEEHLKAGLAFVDWLKKQGRKKRLDFEVDCLKRASYINKDLTPDKVRPDCPTWLVDTIGAASKDKNWLVRLITAKLLEKIGGKRIAPYILNVFRNPTEECFIRDTVAAMGAATSIEDPVIVKDVIASFGLSPVLDKACNEMLTKIVGHYAGLVETDEQRAKTASNWQSWYKENGEYLTWNSETHRFDVDAEAKKAQVPRRYWMHVPVEHRKAWSDINEQRRLALLDKAKAEDQRLECIQEKAWEAGIALKVWMLIPEASRAKWKDLPDKEREELIAEAEKKLSEQEEKESENPEQETSGEKASQPAEPEP